MDFSCGADGKQGVFKDKMISASLRQCGPVPNNDNSGRFFTIREKDIEENNKKKYNGVQVYIHWAKKAKRRKNA